MLDGHVDAGNTYTLQYPRQVVGKKDMAQYGKLEPEIMLSIPHSIMTKNEHVWVTLMAISSRKAQVSQSR